MENLFVEIHGELLEKLDERENDKNIRLIEARSIVKIAEEMFLEGKTFIAIILLNEAEQLLRHAY